MKEYLLNGEQGNLLTLLDSREGGGIEKITIITGRDEFIPYKGKKVLAWQKTTLSGQHSHPYVLVAGCVSSPIYRTGTGAKAVKCTSLLREERADLEQILAQLGFQGPVSFNLKAEN